MVAKIFSGYKSVVVIQKCSKDKKNPRDKKNVWSLQKCSRDTKVSSGYKNDLEIKKKKCPMDIKMF